MGRLKQSAGNEKGFTLVELIVVLILVSILAAMAVPSYLGYVDDTHEKECRMNLKRLASYLDDMRVTGTASMEDVIAAHPEIECPEGGEYEAVGDSAVKSAAKCTKHTDLEVVVASRGDGSVTVSDETIKNGTVDDYVPE